MLEGAVVGAFGRRGEEAAGEFLGFEMIGDALAAEAFAGTGAVAARALLEVFGLMAFHEATFNGGMRVL
jgi:hypothetical protein